MCNVQSMGNSHKMNNESSDKEEEGTKVRKGLWSPEEDEKLSTHVLKHGYKVWGAVPKLAGLNRTGKSCRLRWMNYLRPDLKHGKFSREEEQLLVQLHDLVGNRWAYIAAHMPGRTDNDVKNFWNSRIRNTRRADQETVADNMSPDDTSQDSSCGSQLQESVPSEETIAMNSDEDLGCIVRQHSKSFQFNDPTVYSSTYMHRETSSSNTINGGDCRICGEMCPLRVLPDLQQ